MKLGSTSLAGLMSACLLGLVGTSQAQHHLYTFPGDAANHYLYSCAGVGDIDRDGHADVAAGTFYDRPNQNGYMKVYSGRTGRVMLTFRGDSANDWLGWSLDGVGDVNKDGFPDVAVGSHRDDKNSLTNNGTVYVISGAYIFKRIGTQILYQWHGSASGDQLGRRVRSAGDVNNDGYPDIIAGAWFGNYARVFSGKDGKVIWTLSGLTGLFGTGVDGAGDVDGDGHDDLIVGGHSVRNGSNTGAAQVFSGKTGTPLWTVYGNGSLFGFQVAGVGDLNLDKVPEVAVSAATAHSVFVYNGRTGKLLATIQGNGNWLGYSLNGAGDINKDGFPDFVAGASRESGNAASSGAIWVISGKWFLIKTSPQVLYKFSGTSAGDQIGTACAVAGDINNDGYLDVLGGSWYDDDKGTSSGSVIAFSGKPLTMTTDFHYLQVSKASIQNITVHAGLANKGRNYWIFGSITGTTPGVNLASATGTVTMPLNPDIYTDITIAFANVGPFVKTRGVLDATGEATAQIKAGPLNASAIGVVLYHAALIYDNNSNFYLGTNYTPLLLEK